MTPEAGLAAGGNLVLRGVVPWSASEGLGRVTSLLGFPPALDSVAQGFGIWEKAGGAAAFQCLSRGSGCPQSGQFMQMGAGTVQESISSPAAPPPGHWGQMDGLGPTLAPARAPASS